MARRQSRKLSSLSQILEQIGNRFDESELQIVGTCLKRCAFEAADFLGEASDHWQVVLKAIQGILQQLPRTFKERFLFDSLLIQTITEEWRSGGAHLTEMLVPKVSDQWGHMTVPFPSFSRETIPHVDLILFPGDETVESIDLLDYPFLIHELGHNALFTYGEGFVDTFGHILTEHINALRRRSLADKGLAKSLAQRTISELELFWRPTPDHYNWAHEIAADLIALWSVGPAYLAAFEDVVDADSIDPFRIGKSHPPYDVRLNALIRASDRLHWNQEASVLIELQKRWQKNSPRQDNRYAALCDRSLINGCTDTALRLCHDLRLPRCSIQKVNEVENMISQDKLPDIGTEMLIGAWLAWKAMNESDYEIWEKKTVYNQFMD